MGHSHGFSTYEPPCIQTNLHPAGAELLAESFGGRLGDALFRAGNCQGAKDVSGGAGEGVGIPGRFGHDAVCH